MSGLPPPELQRLREEFRKKYEQFEEYQKWAAEKDVGEAERVVEIPAGQIGVGSGKTAGSVR